jgi:monoamine oxidase
MPCLPCPPPAAVVTSNSENILCSDCNITSETNPSNMREIAIVGGGLAGLYTAYRLLIDPLRNQQPFTGVVHIYESSDRFGGRIHTVDWHNGVHVDAGASRFNNGHKRVLRLLRKLKLGEDHWYAIKDSSQVVVKNGRPSKKIDIDAMSAHIIEAAKKCTPSYLKRRSLEMFIREIYDNDTADTYIQGFGYDAHFETYNAYEGLHSLIHDFRGTLQYHVLKQGLSRMVERLTELLEAHPRCHLHLRHCVVGYEQTPPHNKSVLSFKNDQQHAKTVDFTYFCITRPPLQCLIPQLNVYDSQIAPSLKRNYSAPLNRIYALFPMDKNGKAWFDGMPNLCVNNPIRKCIPINAKTGLIMISYTEGRYAFQWNDLGTKSDDLKRNLMLHLRRALPYNTIPDPLHVESFHWNVGAHCWAPNRRLYKPEQAPASCSFRLAGEVVAHAYQGWMEGALMSAEAAMRSTTA